ncbi:MAG: hypothetical protein MJY97_06060 [Bacteroidales bacterium]|nr:hypothetical protein [Bacteroidales bacterium]
MKRIFLILAAVIGLLTLSSCTNKSFDGYWHCHVPTEDSPMGFAFDAYYEISGKDIKHYTVIYDRDLIMLTGEVMKAKGNAKKGNMTANFSLQEVYSAKADESKEIQKISDYAILNNVLITKGADRYVKIDAEQMPDMEQYKVHEHNEE